MKKVLLFCMGLSCALLSHAQLLINEVYVRPGNNSQEYFELVNASPAPENTGCYTLVSYFKEGQKEGFYVVSLPAMSLAPKGLITASSQAPNFNYQNGTGHADFSWNAGHIKRYLRQNGSFVMNNSGAPFNDIFVKSGPNGGVYAIFLFKGNQLADAFMGSGASNTVPSFITAMGQLDIASLNACGNYSYNFGNINNEEPTLFGHVNSEAGTNNGYYRNEFCEWEKASAPSESTPGAPNSNMDCSQTLGHIIAEAECLNATTIGYTLYEAPSRSFPITVRTYFDANGSQFLDDGDVLINTSVLQPTALNNVQMVQHPAGQEDFLIMFDATAWCQDTIIAVNCPAGIILPVTLQSFTASRNGSQVSLKWITATEINNRGFNLQRMQGNGRWETVAFIPSQATGGNSNVPLTYSYSEMLRVKGITQYRLEQVDIDGRTKYSDIRSIRNEGTSAGSVVLYPNPARGAVNIQFENAGVLRDVLITDMNGRTVKQWRSVSTQNLQCSDLTPGLYTVRVIDQHNGTQFTDRLVVSGR